MPIYLLRAKLQHTSNLPEDVDINDFVVNAADPVAGTAAIDRVGGFYRDTGVGQTLSIGKYLAKCIDRGPGKFLIEQYDITGHLDGSPHGPPIVTVPLDMAVYTGSDADLPAEVAACVSFHADLSAVSEHVGNTRPRARRRGRIFVGPLKAGTATLGGPNEVFLDGTFRADLAAAGHNLLAGLTADGAPLQVWSRVDAVVRPVVGGFVDNTFDTQRRRGLKATLRTLFTA